MLLLLFFFNIHAGGNFDCVVLSPVVQVGLVNIKAFLSFSIKNEVSGKQYNL